MSFSERLSRRAALALSLATALSACGFTPVYGPAGRGTALDGQIQMPTPQSTDEVRLIARLEERLGAAGPSPRFALTLRLELSRAGQAVTIDQRTGRVNVVGRLGWSLTEIATGSRVAQDVEQSFTSYSTTANTASTLAASEDASERLMVILADQLIDGVRLNLAEEVAR